MSHEVVDDVANAFAALQARNAPRADDDDLMPPLEDERRSDGGAYQAQQQQQQQQQQPSAAPAFVAPPAAAIAPAPAAASSSAPAPANAALPRRMEKEVDPELQRLRPVMHAISDIANMISDLPEFDVETIPAFSLALDKDAINIGACTKGGYSKMKGMLAKRIGDLDAELENFATAAQRYSEKLNAACEQKYKLQVYRQELAATQSLRLDELTERVEKRQNEHEGKLAKSVVYAHRYEKKQDKKRRKLGTDEGTKPSIFDAL